MSMNKKLQKLQAKQNAVIENKKIKEAAEAINTNTAVTTPQQPQEPDLPIYNSALYNNLSPLTLEDNSFGKSIWTILSVCKTFFIPNFLAIFSNHSSYI